MEHKLRKNEHYYLDQNGLLVFTAKYLEERGFCCKNGCRHCPYGFEKTEAKVTTFTQKPAGSSWPSAS